MRSLAYIILFIFFSTWLHAQTSLDTAVNFTVKDVNGITHLLHEYLEQDKIVVIDFFTITCGPCSVYAPFISESYSHFGCNTSNVIFLGINWGADNAGVTDFGNIYGVHYPEISGIEGNGNHVVADYGILSYPTVILILPDSYVAEKFIWPPSTQHLDSIILLHGGIFADCNTPLASNYKAEEFANRILSVKTYTEQSIVECSTSVNEKGFFEVCSLSGSTVISNISVLPGVCTRIATYDLSQGYYLLVLRNKKGIILDRKPFIVQKR